MSSIQYPRTPIGYKIETMYVDTLNEILYVGGDFTSLELPPSYSTTASRHRIAAIDLTTGKLLPWSPSVDDGTVYTISKIADTLYAGGDFTKVEGQAAKCLVALDANINNLNHTYNFSAGDIVKTIYVDSSHLFVGGIINQYGLQPDSVKTVNDLIEIDAVTGKLKRKFSNILSSDYFGNVSKIYLENNKLYFIAERISAPTYGPYFVLEKPIFYFDLSFTNGNPEYLIEPSTPFYSSIPKIDDFTKTGDDIYIIGDFSQLLYGLGGNNFINQNQTACYNLTSNSFKSWNPLIAYSTNLSSLESSYSFMGHSITSFEDWLFLSLPYSTTINAKESVYQKSIQTFNDITGLPVLGSSTPKSGLFFSDMNRCNGNLILINREISQFNSGPNAFPGGYNQRNLIYSYCLKTRDATVPREMNNLTTFCKYKSYQFYEPNRPDYNSCQWSYSGTGATITNNGNDTITITFALNASPGNLIIHGINSCGQSGNTNFTAISFYPVPNVNAGQDSFLNCTNNQKIILSGTTSALGGTLKWNGPKIMNALPNTTIDTSGTYYLTVTDLNTCRNVDTMQLRFDTISPIITCPLSYSINKCIPNYISINGTSDNFFDSIKWFGPGIPTTNPAKIFNANNYIIEAKRNTNGCKTTSLVTVNNITSAPKFFIPPSADSVSQGILIIDTLTCSNDFVLLNFSGNSANSIITIKRPTSMNDTVTNNTYSSAAGIYTAYIIDTVSKCNGNPLLFEIKIDKTLPLLSILNNSPTINCSISNVILDGASATPNAQLIWKGPNNFSSTDPTLISETGNYILTVTDPDNGCKKSDSVTVTKQNTLIILGSADTTICKGSIIQLYAKPLGGKPNITYSWNTNGNDSVIYVSPLDTTQYIVTISDAANCIGKDTININIPKQITDSTITIQPCDPSNPNGQIQIFASGGIAPYQYSFNNGLTYQSSSIFKNLTLGNYQLEVKDSLNCNHTYTTSISALSQIPISDFIVNTNMMQKDTFVVVDISNPRPDTIIWTFPANVIVINNNPYSPIIISADTGVVEIMMETHFGSCMTNFTKKVSFIKADTLPDSPKGNGIESLTLFPNPNGGQFSVETKLYKKQTFAIYIYNSQGIEQSRKTIPISDYNLSTFNLSTPLPGTYLLKIIAEYDSKSKAFIITQ